MPLTRYLQTMRAAGMPLQQAHNFLRAGIVLTPQQVAASVAARDCDRRGGPEAIGYGGARAGGKSHWLLAQMGADDCQRQPGIKCLLLRKVGKANLEHFESLRLRLFGQLPHDYQSNRGILTFANGSKIVAGHFQAEKDIDAYLGLEYDVIGIEEATTLTARKYLDISTCCRTARTGWRPRIYSTTNPGGVGHAWYKRLFITPEPGENRTRFIPARLYDNPFIDREYGSRLEQLGGWQRRAWLEGSWDIAAGQFFSEFSPQRHVRAGFDPSRAVEWMAGFDYGFNHYTVFLLAARDGEGALHVVDEHAARRWLPEQHAEAILALLERHRLSPKRLRGIVAGGDVFARQYDGSSIAGEYLRAGLRLTPANSDRVNGWAEVLRRLGNSQAGLRPSLFIDPRCARLIRELPSLQHDPGRPEDVLKVDLDEDSGEGGDDAADALRYLVTTTPARLARGKIAF